MIREDDFVTHLTRFVARLARMDEQQRRLLEDQIRQEYGGEELGYVRRLSFDGIEQRDAAILNAVRAGEKYRAIAARLCVSVGTVSAVAARKRREKIPVQVLGKN